MMRLGLVLLALVLLASGCGIVGNGNGNGADLPEVYVGKEALTVKFMDNSPPKKVVTNSDIVVGLLIKNNGATGVEKTVPGTEIKGTVSLSLNDAYLKVKEREQSKKYFTDKEFERTEADAELREYFLFGRETSSAGESRIVRFSVEVLPLKKEDYKENPTTTVLATVCYPYNTVLAAPVCIDQNPYGTGSKACEMGIRVLGKGQGAPVAVTRIEESFAFSGDDFIPQLKIFVSNAGSGNVVNISDTEKACSAEEVRYNVVTLKEAKLLGQEMACDKRELTLDSEDSDENYFLCRHQPTSLKKEDRSFFTELTAELSYGYVIKESKSVEIDVVDMP